MSDYQDPERLDLPSASHMEIVVECPGVTNLKKTLPSEAFSTIAPDDDEWARKGDRIHKAFETDNPNELDPEEFRIYQNGTKHTQLLLEKWIHDKALDPAKVVEGPRELRVWLHDPINFPKLLGSAKLDRHWIYRDEQRTCVLVVDLKSGWNPSLPSPSSSWQLKFQLLALWREEYDNVTDGRVAYARDKEKLDDRDWCDYEMMDLKFSWDALVYHLWMSTQADAPRHAGVHCRWCPARNGYCPEALAYSLLPSVIVKDVFNKKSVAPAVDKVTHADLLKVWQMGTIVENIIEGVTKRLKGLTEEELLELGLKFGKGRETHEITLTKEAFECLRDTHGWPEEKIWAALKFVSTRMVEYLEIKGMDEKAGKAWIREELKGFITVKESEKSLREI